MSLTNRDVESAYLDATAQMTQWKEEFVASWFAPEMEAMLSMFWLQMDPAMKMYFRQTNPAAYREMERRVKGMMEGGKNGEATT